MEIYSKSISDRDLKKIEEMAMSNYLLQIKVLSDNLIGSDFGENGFAPVEIFGENGFAQYNRPKAHGPK